MRRIIFACLLISLAPVSVSAQEAKPARVPSWDARGVGPLPRMGITSLDVSDDGKEIVVGTIAAFGDPNVIVLSEEGKILRTYRVGQQWIDNVAFMPGSQEVIAICTMPHGKAGDKVEAFRCKGDEVVAEKINQEGPWFFHYGEHSNHPTMKLARASRVSGGCTALLAGDQVVIHRKGKEPAMVRIPVKSPHASVSLAVDESGWAVVGTTAGEDGHNLFLIDPDQKKPVWSRAVNKDVDKAPALEKGLYGTPTLPDGKREELPQRDEKVWAPLSVAIHRGEDGKRQIAAADYQGWQRWVRSSATMHDDNQGVRFTAAKPTITVYDASGMIIRQFGAKQINETFWCDLLFNPFGNHLFAWVHHWRCRGLAGQSTLPADDLKKYLDLFIPTGEVNEGGAWDLLVPAPGKQMLSDFTVGPGPNTGATRWNGVSSLSFGPPVNQLVTKHEALAGPALLRVLPGEGKWVIATIRGRLTLRFKLRDLWEIDLNTAVPKSLKPWVANAKATPIVSGVWQIPGGRVESDLGGQRVIEAPDGLILIEGHAGLSFEREWAAMENAGLDPRRVKYVLATHEHGDHAPGAYLWRVVTGAKFVCSEEMAYTLQHHIPLNTGYGLHPPVPTDIVVKKDTELDLAGLKVKAIRIPGHTYGSMAWYFEMASRVELLVKHHLAAGERAGLVAAQDVHAAEVLHRG